MAELTTEEAKTLHKQLVLEKERLGDLVRKKQQLEQEQRKSQAR